MKKLDRFIDLIGASLPSGDKATRRRTACLCRDDVSRFRGDK
jgi:hypothetical protein